MGRNLERGPVLLQGGWELAFTLGGRVRSITRKKRRMKEGKSLLEVSQQCLPYLSNQMAPVVRDLAWDLVTEVTQCVTWRR